MSAREELAAVLAEHVRGQDPDDPRLPSMFCDCGEVVYTCGVDNGWLYRTHVADALLASPALARVIREAKAEAWDKCIQGVAWAFDHGPDGAALGYARDHNPYRAP